MHRRVISWRHTEPNNFWIAFMKYIYPFSFIHIKCTYAVHLLCEFQTNSCATILCCPYIAARRLGSTDGAALRLRPGESVSRRRRTQATKTGQIQCGCCCFKSTHFHNSRYDDDEMDEHFQSAARRRRPVESINKKTKASNSWINTRCFEGTLRENIAKGNFRRNFLFIYATKISGTTTTTTKLYALSWKMKISIVGSSSICTHLATRFVRCRCVACVRFVCLCVCAAVHSAQKEQQTTPIPTYRVGPVH